ncbi:uncharacterized protein [Cherax quadricarinatus]
MEVPSLVDHIARVTLLHQHHISSSDPSPHQHVHNMNSRSSKIIYRADVWGKALVSALHWAPISYSTRAILEHQGLILENISLEDSGEYSCEVEFFRSPPQVSRTRLSVVDARINLTLVSEDGVVVGRAGVPQDNLTLVSEDGVVVGRAGVPQDIVVTVAGSKPPFTVSGIINGTRYTAEQLQETQEARTINYTIRWIPSASHDGEILNVTVFSNILPHRVASVSSKLSVLYAPLVQVMPEFHQHIEVLKEPDDNQHIEVLKEFVNVTLRCIVRANPPASNFTWMHNGESVNTSVTTDVLELRNITRQASGEYNCRASNSEGTNSSNNLLLQVKYAPVCVEKQQAVSYAAGTLTHISCPVEAYPSPYSYRWSMLTKTGERNVDPSICWRNSRTHNSRTHNSRTRGENSSTNSSHFYINRDGDSKGSSISSSRSNILSSSRNNNLSSSRSNSLNSSRSNSLSSSHSNIVSSNSSRLHCRSTKTATIQVLCRATNLLGEQHQPCVVNITTVKTEVAARSVAEVVPSSLAEVVPSSLAEVVPSSLAEVVPSSLAEVVPSSLAEVVPSSLAEVVPSSLAEVVPSSLAEVVPSSLAEVVPSSLAEVVPSSLAEVVPSSLAEVVPSSTTEPSRSASSDAHDTEERFKTDGTLKKLNEGDTMNTFSMDGVTEMFTNDQPVSVIAVNSDVLPVSPSSPSSLLSSSSSPSLVVVVVVVMVVVVAVVVVVVVVVVVNRKLGASRMSSTTKSSRYNAVSGYYCLNNGDLEAGSLEAGSLEAGSLEAGSLEAGSLEAGSLEAGSLTCSTHPCQEQLTIVHCESLKYPHHQQFTPRRLNTEKSDSREMNSVLSDSRAPRASMDSIQLSSGSPSVCDDPLRSSQLSLSSMTSDLCHTETSKDGLETAEMESSSRIGKPTETSL